MTNSETDFPSVNPARQLAHDLRSPLSALRVILGSNDELTKGSRAILKLALERIDEILAGNENRREISELSRAIQDVVHEKRAILKNRPGLTLSVRTFDEAHVQIGAGLLKRVLSNLLDNAIEAIPGRGQVDIEMSRNATTATVAIRDSGVGFPESILHRLGLQGLSVGKNRGPGQGGLGLSHAKQAVEDAGGRLSARNTACGTLVTIQLPLASPGL